jgi:hypothetical protein
LVGMARESTTVVIEKTSALAKAKGVLMTVAYRFRNRHGEWKDNTREVYDNGNSAVVLPYDPDRGTIHFTSQIPPTTLLRFKIQLEYVAATMLSASAVGRISDAGKFANAISARKAVPPACPTVAFIRDMRPMSRANNGKFRFEG